MDAANLSPLLFSFAHREKYMSLIEQGDKPEPPSIAWKSNDVTLDTLSLRSLLRLKFPPKITSPSRVPRQQSATGGCNILDDTERLLPCKLVLLLYSSLLQDSLLSHKQKIEQSPGSPSYHQTPKIEFVCIHLQLIITRIGSTT